MKVYIVMGMEGTSGAMDCHEWVEDVYLDKEKAEDFAEKNTKKRWAGDKEFWVDDPREVVE